MTPRHSRITTALGCFPQRQNRIASCDLEALPAAAASEGGRLLIFAGVPDLGFQDERAIAVVVVFGPRDKIDGIPRAQPVEEEV